jgi:hypothetical protein
MEVNHGNIDLHPPPPPVMVVRQHVIESVNDWRESSEDDERWLFFPDPCTRLEAVFVVGNLRHELPLQGDPNGPLKTTLALTCISNEALGVFCGFLQEAPGHLRSLFLGDLTRQHLRRLIEALHSNSSVEELSMDGLEENDGTIRSVRSP